MSHENVSLRIKPNFVCACMHFYFLSLSEIYSCWNKFNTNLAEKMNEICSLMFNGWYVQNRFRAHVSDNNFGEFNLRHFYEENENQFDKNKNGSRSVKWFILLIRMCERFRESAKNLFEYIRVLLFGSDRNRRAVKQVLVWIL